MSDDVWCDITITATSYDLNCDSCGTWFAHSKGRELDKVEVIMSDHPDNSSKDTRDLILTLMGMLTYEIKEVADYLGLELDDLD